MLKLFIGIFALILLYWIYKKKGQFFVRHHHAEPVITTIQAVVIQTFLDKNTPLECLLDDGQKFGDRFKMKAPPDLPHTEGCLCEIFQSYYTSSDVFQGENSERVNHPSALGALGSMDANILKKLLIRTYNAHGYTSYKSMLEEFDLDLISDSIRVELLSLVEDAFQVRRQTSSLEKC